MTVDELYVYYDKSWTEIGKNTDFSTASVWRWRKKGYIPIDHQVKIERVTAGKFKADLNHMPREIDTLKEDRNLIILSLIKSNLVSLGLPSEIDEVVFHLSKDIFDLLNKADKEITHVA